MSNHFIIDFETMGKDASKCAIVDCSVMVFNFDRFSSNPYTLNSVKETKKFKGLKRKDSDDSYDSVRTGMTGLSAMTGLTGVSGVSGI